MLLSPLLQLESIQEQLDGLQEQLDGLHEQLNTLSGRDHMQERSVYPCVHAVFICSVSERYSVSLRTYTCVYIYIHVQMYTVLCLN